jgi:hypothetical protein
MNNVWLRLESVLLLKGGNEGREEVVLLSGKGKKLKSPLWAEALKLTLKL